MKHSDINLTGLSTSWRCAEVMDLMEEDFRNYQGGLKHWNSGRLTLMTKAAALKWSAIKERMYRLEDRGL